MKQNLSISDHNSNSYITNCHFEINDSGDPLFESKDGGKTFIVRLDNYAIIPMEVYKQLTKNNATAT